MTETPPDPDDYWHRLIRSRGVGQEGYSFFGGTLSRPLVRRAGNIHSIGVLESLIGASRILDLSVLGRTMSDDGSTRWFLMEISPVYNTWHVEYEGGFSDTNLGRAGRVSGSERSAGPIPRGHLQHPSNLIYYDHLPIWGGIGHSPDNLLPGAVDVLWQETAAASEGGPEWRMADTPGDLARIELTCPTDPDSEGTAIFDLRRRMCLLYERRYQGETYFRMLVDAVKQDNHQAWMPLTEVGEATTVASSPSTDAPE